jgi:hypothetical protein
MPFTGASGFRAGGLVTDGGTAGDLTGAGRDGAPGLDEADLSLPFRSAVLAVGETAGAAIDAGGLAGGRTAGGGTFLTATGAGLVNTWVCIVDSGGGTAGGAKINGDSSPLKAGSASSIATAEAGRFAGSCSKVHITTCSVCGETSGASSRTRGKLKGGSSCGSRPVSKWCMVAPSE